MRIRTQRIVLALIFLGMLTLENNLWSQTGEASSAFVVGRLKYGGGGDWYNDPSSIPNLLSFLKTNTNIHTGTDEKRIQIMNEELFSLPMLYMTGHGRIHFSDEESRRLREYLTAGGFLYVDDDYGMDKYFRHEIKKVFHDKKLIELPASHPIFHCHYDFPQGLPKTHEHDPGSGQAFAIYHEGRMVLFYTFNSNISDGWADPDVHKDSEDTRQEALKMGLNIVVYALTQ